ncbi:MAG: hypothetical protein AB1894_12585 [Chloroflexota bacterium]
MHPVRGSEVMLMDFVGEQYGWALVMYSYEGPGDKILFHSQDGGLTWREGGSKPAVRSIPAAADRTILPGF